MSKFKFLKENPIVKNESYMDLHAQRINLEIAHQLKRIADKLEQEMENKQ